MKMYGSRFRMWSIFTAWLVVGVLCGVLDNARKSTLFLPIFLVSSIATVLVATRKHRARNYKFELVRPGVVRSPFGFEVRVSSSRLEYVEGDHMIWWLASPVSATVARFNFSENGISGWDSPFDTEPMDSDKKRQVAKAVRSALLYLQLVDAGKIRPKRVR